MKTIRALRGNPEDAAEYIAAVLGYNVETPRRLRELAAALERETVQMVEALLEEASAEQEVGEGTGE